MGRFKSDKDGNSFTNVGDKTVDQDGKSQREANNDDTDFDEKYDADDEDQEEDTADDEEFRSKSRKAIDGVTMIESDDLIKAIGTIVHKAVADAVKRIDLSDAIDSVRRQLSPIKKAIGEVSDLVTELGEDMRDNHGDLAKSIAPFGDVIGFVRDSRQKDDELSKSTPAPKEDMVKSGGKVLEKGAEQGDSSELVKALEADLHKALSMNINVPMAEVMSIIEGNSTYKAAVHQSIKDAIAARTR